MIRSDLVVDVCISLSPAQVVPKGTVSWIADSSAVKNGQLLQLCPREEARPGMDVMGSETAGDEGDQLTLPPAWHAYFSLSS